MKTAPLTPLDLKALRTADHYSIQIADGLATVTCYQQTKRQPKRVDPFDATMDERSYQIVSEPNAYETIRAWFYLYGNTGAMRAMATLARVGDVLTIRAYNNNNQYLDRADLFHDECSVSLHRGTRTIARNVVVASSTCPANSARAIREVA